MPTLTPDSPTALRLPPSLKAQVVELAKVERRSINSQLVVLVEKGLAANGPPERLFDPPRDRRDGCA